MRQKTLLANPMGEYNPRESTKTMLIVNVD